MWQWLDNTQYPLMSLTATKYEQSDWKGEIIEIFHRCFDFMWYFYGQRHREEFKKALEVACEHWPLKFFPGIKIKPEWELCFQSLVVKRKDVLAVWKSLIYQLLPKLCASIGFTRPGQRRQNQCFRYLSSDLQHPAVKRVFLLQMKLERGSHVLRIADSTKALAWLCLCLFR